MKWLAKPNLFLKVAIFLLLALALYWQVFHRVELDKLLGQFRENVKGDAAAITWFLAAGLLVFANWGVESLKWQQLISRLQKISFTLSFKAVLTGVTLGVFTPNRIGEYAGRVLYLEKKQRFPAVVATLVGSFSQIIATFLTGITALLAFLPHFYDLQSYTFLFVVFITLLLFLLLVLLYFNLDVVLAFLNHFGFFRKYRHITQVAQTYAIKELSIILGLSLLRYLVFTAQYLILFRLFGLPFSPAEGWVVIGLIFFVQTIVPSFAIAELLTRSNIAVFFVSYYYSNELGAIAASTTLWLLNLILPAVAGLFFTGKVKIFHENAET